MRCRAAAQPVPARRSFLGKVIRSGGCALLGSGWVLPGAVARVFKDAEGRTAAGGDVSSPPALHAAADDRQQAPREGETAVEAGPRHPVGPGRDLVPPRGIAIRPGQSIQSVVDRSAEGAVFILEAGIHARQSISPKNGQQFHGQFGAVLDGQRVTQRAFEVGGCRDVLISNLVIEHYVPGNDTCVVEGGRTAWGEIENCEIRHCSGYGVRVGGAMRRCHLHHNGQGGFSVYYLKDTLIEDCELAFHNHVRKTLDGTTGGCKCWNSDGTTIRHCWSHENFGAGLWADANNINLRVEHNRVEKNTSHGIVQEIGYRAVIRNNVVSGHRNLGDGTERGAIAIVKSRDVEVSGNFVTDNDCGIVILEERREDNGEHAYEVWETRSARIEGNTLARNRVHAGAISWGGDPFEADDDNRFRSNSYREALSARPFRWAGRGLTWTQWRAFGHDLEGDYVHGR